MKKLFKMLLIGSMLISLTACGTASIAEAIEASYSLENVVPGQAGYEMAKVYRVPNKEVPDMVKELSDSYPPLEVSKESSEKMFMVYQELLLTIQQDVEKKEDVLIEVANKDFVRENYGMSFFQAYLIADVVEDLFELKYRKKGYRGYIGPGGYTQYGGTIDPKKFKERRRYYGDSGSVRNGSTGNSTTRGGGPSVGK